MKQVRCSVIVVSFNTREMTLACLESLFADLGVGEGGMKVVVVDNASTDGSADAIAEQLPQVELIRSSKNLGFAAANNLAAKRAQGEYLLLLNPDTVVLDGAIVKLMALAKTHPTAGIWGGRTVYADGSLNPSSCWRRATLWNQFCRAVGLSKVIPNSPLFNSEAYGGWQRDSVREVDIVSGCFFLIRRELWERLGGFDEAFFMYGEEADLCLRARKLGARPMVTPDATIIHYGGASETVAADKIVRLLKAKALLIRRHWSPALVTIGLALLRCWCLSRSMVESRRARASTVASRQPTGWREVWCRRQEWSSSVGDW